MATHTRYPNIEKYAESTGRRSIQLWRVKYAIRILDGTHGERDIRWTGLLDSLIKEANDVKGTQVAAKWVQRRKSVMTRARARS